MNVYDALLAVDDDGEQASLIAESVLGLPGDPEEISALVLNVLESDSDEEGEASDTPDLSEAESVPASVTDVVDRLEDAGVTVGTRRERGDPATEILSVAQEIDADGIVLSGRHRTPTGKALFGNTTQSVLLQAERPVITVLTE